MKQKLRLMGLLCPKNSHYNIQLPMLLLAISPFIMCLYAAKQASAQVAEPAAAAVDPEITSGPSLHSSIKPLQIGDTIPEALWQLPLQVVNYSDRDTSLMLNNYRGKTILLDFLSTGCSGCIAAIPKLEAIQAEFGNEVIIIPVTPQKRDRVATFIPQNKHISSTQLPFVVEDKVLKEHFPHQYISHVVWIDEKGIVRAFTGTNHVTAGTVREFRSGVALDWPVKSESTPFFNAPLVTLNADANILPHNTNRTLYYSMITGYTEGVGPYVATRQDSLMGIQRISYRNKSILDLYRIAIEERLPSRTDIIIEAKNPAHYAQWNADLNHQTIDQWYQSNGVCYERTLPLGTPMAQWRKMMLSDLNNLLNLNGRMEERDNRRKFVLSENNLSISKPESN